MELRSYGLCHSRLKGLSVPGLGHCWAVMSMLLGPWRAGGGLGAAPGAVSSPGLHFWDGDELWTSTCRWGITIMGHMLCVVLTAQQLV